MMNHHQNHLHHQQQQNFTNGNFKQPIIHTQQQQQQQSLASSTTSTTTTDAFIVHSNSNIVSDEFLLQLQEQFGGENKQIYIFNTSNTTQTPQANNDTNNGTIAPQQQPIQYLIVDKDVDINLILQDPNILSQLNQQQTLPQSQPIGNFQQQQQQQTENLTHTNNSKTKLVFNNGHQTNRLMQNNNNLTNNSTSSLNSNNGQMFVEESIQRVQAPPPKRKQFELKLENKKNSYQDVFMRYLAGEKQPTLELIAEQASKKPKDNVYYAKPNNNKPAVLSAPLLANSTTPAPTTTTTTNTTTTATGSHLNSTNSLNLDKENYYNSSRRENLQPLNNYEYRNSYKDHYDNQGVRLNPAILKNLTYGPVSGVAQANNNNNNESVVRVSNTHAAPLSLQRKKISETGVSSSPPPPPPPPQIISSTQSPLTKSSIVITKSNTLANNSTTTTTAAAPAHQIYSSTYSSNDENIASSQLGLQAKIAASQTIVGSNGSNCVAKAGSELSLNGEQCVVGRKRASSLLDQHEKSNAVVFNGALLKAKSLKTSETNDSPGLSLGLEQAGTINDSTKIQTTVTNTLSASIIEPTTTTTTTTTTSNSVQPVAVVMPTLIDDQQTLPSNQIHLDEEVTFSSGEFLIHKSTFSGDFENYDIWCVLDEAYLQKYEPVLLASGERCHQSADVLAQYTPDKTEFILVKVEEKGKTEQNNIVVGVLDEYEPKNRKMFSQLNQLESSQSAAAVANNKTTTQSANTVPNPIQQQPQQQQQQQQPNVVVVTYDDLKNTLDVFLQVLLSQHLNAEFLIRIKEIQDEYFRPSIEFIDTILSDKYTFLIANLAQFMNMGKKAVPVEYQLEPVFKYLLETRPKLFVHHADVASRGRCQGLLPNEYLSDDKLKAQYLVKFGGQAYNADTLSPLTSTELLLANEKLEKESGEKSEFVICARTLQFTQLCHSLKHLKIHFYEICQQKIEIVKSQIDSCLADPSGGTAAPDILNYCLADMQWLLEMFEKFKQLLFSVDSFLTDEHQQIMLTQFDAGPHVVDILPQASEVVVVGSTATGENLGGKVLVSSTTGGADCTNIADQQQLTQIISQQNEIYQQSTLIDSTTTTTTTTPLNIQLQR